MDSQTNLSKNEVREGTLPREMAWRTITCVGVGTRHKCRHKCVLPPPPPSLKRFRIPSYSTNKEREQGSGGSITLAKSKEVKGRFLTHSYCGAVVDEFVHVCLVSAVLLFSLSFSLFFSLLVVGGND